MLFNKKHEEFDQEKFDEFLQNAAKLVLTGSYETVKLANSLLKR